MGRITFHGFHEIRDQVVAALELDIDIGPGIVALDFQTDQAVVHANGENDEENDDAKENPT